MLLAQEVLQAYTMISISMMVVFTSLSRGRGRGQEKHQPSDTSGTNPLLHFNGVCVCVGVLLVQAYEDNGKMRTFLEARTFEPVLTHSRAV